MKTLYPFLFLFSFLLSTNSFASGCFPEDVQLEEEKVVGLMPDQYKADLKCIRSGDCILSVKNSRPGMGYEVYYLYLQPKDLSMPYEEFADVKLKIYKQHFVSSCSDFFRIVLGAEVRDLRFRSEKDLEVLQ